MELSTGLAAIKALTTGVEVINRLLSVISDSSNREQLVHLKESILNAKEEALALREEVLSLRDKLSNKETLEFDRGADAYYKKAVEGLRDGPFCKTCWDKDSKLIRLDTRGYCAVCKEGYGEIWREG